MFWIIIDELLCIKNQFAGITKTVRFSNPLVKYQNTVSVDETGFPAKCGTKQSKKQAKGELVKNGTIILIMLQSVSDLFIESIEIISWLSITDSIIRNRDVSRCRPWITNSHRWIARLEYLSEMSPGFIKTLHSTRHPSLSIAYCDSERNLLIGNGYLAVLNSNCDMWKSKVCCLFGISIFYLPILAVTACCDR